MSQIGESPTCELQSIYLQKSSDNLADQKYICFCQLFVHSSTVGAVVKEKKQQLQSAPGWHQQQSTSSKQQSSSSRAKHRHFPRPQPSPAESQPEFHSIPSHLPLMSNKFYPGWKEGGKSFCKNANLYYFSRTSGAAPFCYVPSDASPPSWGEDPAAELNWIIRLTEAWSGREQQ